ncbi:MAG: hypothetical protein QW076_04890, partial [Candidatus Anstonellales archaeon]
RPFQLDAIKFSFNVFPVASNSTSAIETSSKNLYAIKNHIIFSSIKFELNDEISKRGFDSSAIAKIIAEKLEGKSGGEKTIAQGFGRKIDNEIFQSIICEVRNYVINKLK